MHSEPRSFLRARAVAEANMAARASSRPAAWSHSHLARLYLERCIEVEGPAEDCVTCELRVDCLGLQYVRLTASD